MKEKLSKRLLKEDMSNFKYKDVGTCFRKKGSQAINRSKFKNAQDAQDQLTSLLNIGVVNPSFVVYQCPECHMWHFGLHEWSEK